MMKSKIYDIGRGCCFKDRKILFDTNIWIYINEIGPDRELAANYSAYYRDALKNGNEIVVNDYVISEYFNRVLKIEFEKSFPAATKRDFKRLRKDPAFIQRAESVRDDCINILEDNVYVARDATIDCLNLSINSAAKCVLDFTDSMHVEQCKKNGYVFVSHDSDFISCGLDFVTANSWVLRNARAN